MNWRNIKYWTPFIIEKDCGKIIFFTGGSDISYYIRIGHKDGTHITIPHAELAKIEGNPN